MLDAPCPGLHRRASRIVALASGGPGRTFGQGEAPAVALPEPEPLDAGAILRGIDLLLPRIQPVPREALEAPPDHPAYVPLGDPDRTWRRQGRWMDAVFTDDQQDGPQVLRGKTQAELLDLWFAACENLRRCIDPEVRAFASRMAQAGDAIRRGDTDVSGRAIPLGRMLGLQGAAVSSAAALNRDDRNRLITRARAAVPEWAEAGPFAAAAAIRDAFVRYRDSGGFAADRATPAGKEGRAPTAEPRGTFFRLAVLGGLPGGAFPEEDTLARFLRDQ